MQKLHLRVMIFGLSRLFALVLFGLVALIVIYSARGYKFNAQTWGFEPTGAIELKGDVTDATIILGAQIVGSQLPLTVSGLAPHRVVGVRILKSGFHEWRKDFTVEPEMIAAAVAIRLWPDNLKAVRVAADQTPAANLCLNNQPSKADTLQINSSELRLRGRLITRISDPISSACWFRDGAHIIFATTNQVRVMELDGANDTTLLSLDTPISEVVAQSDGRSVLVRTGAQWWRIDL